MTKSLKNPRLKLVLKTSISINLKKTQKENSLDKFIDWALKIGRILVIITELIALAAFLYRFTLDQQLADITTKIKQEQVILVNFKKNEDKFRNLQDRLALASNSIQKTNQRVKLYNDIIGFAPVGFTFNTISLFAGRIQMTADVSSVLPLSAFVNSLKSYDAISDVSIDNITNKITGATISVSITANLKQNFKVDETTQ